MTRTLTLLIAASAAALASAPAQAQYNQPTGGPLSTIFSCNNANNRQGTGAIVGALVGGLAGNQINDNDRTTGTLVGAALGAAAGSMIGCRMQSQDVARAQQTTQQALASGRSQAWNNPQTGAAGRVDIVNTYNYGSQGGGGGYQQQQQQAAYNRPTLNTVRWINGVEQPREYQQSEGTYQAQGSPVIRSGPSQRARQLGTLRNGEQFDGLVRVEGTDWVLASRGGQVLGYVQESQARFMGETYAQQNTNTYGNNQNYNNNNNANGGYAPYDPRGGQMCRVFDSTFTQAGGQAQTQRYTACQTANGEWVVQS